MKKHALSLLVVVAVAATTLGCASRRYVRNRTEPLGQQVGELNTRTAEQGQKIEQLDEKTDREISRVDEKAGAADARANEATRQATEAMNKTGQAMEKAERAQSVAEGSLARTDQLQKYVENFDTFEMSSSKTIYFGFDKSTLSKDAQAELDALASSLSGQKFVIEVQGFTDTTGDSEYNYALSERRAAAVVRYLTEQHQIPVYRVHTIGMGKSTPVEAASKREARKLSRRVEVKVYTRGDMPQTAQQAAPSDESSATTRREPEQQ